MFLIMSNGSMTEREMLETIDMASSILEVQQIKDLLVDMADGHTIEQAKERVNEERKLFEEKGISIAFSDADNNLFWAEQVSTLDRALERMRRGNDVVKRLLDEKP